MGDSCVECGRSRWFWFSADGGWSESEPELACIKPTVTHPVTGRLMLPATECSRIKPGYGPPQALQPYFYPWPCVFEASGRTKVPPAKPGFGQQVRGILGLHTEDGLGPEDGLEAYAKSLGAELDF